MSDDTKVTKGDLWDVRDTLAEAIEKGFRDVHIEISELSRRIGAGEVQGGVHETRLKNLEREVFGRRRDDVGPIPNHRPPQAHARSKSISERDVRMFVAGVLAVVGVGGFFWKVLPFLINAVQP